MTIHGSHPFADPDPDPVRRLRGRLGGRVTLWTASGERGPAGLTVTSVMVAAGEPGHILGLLDPDSDLAAALEHAGTAVVQLLGWRHRGLAEVFAGVAPAPGGAFGQGSWEETRWGPVLSGVDAWAGVSLAEPRFERSPTVGWSWLVSTRVERVSLGDEAGPLLHHRGRYRRL